jgi:probable HAF family extracellular repeat protein
MKFRSVFVLATLIACWTAIANAQYTITDLGVLAGHQSTAYAINDSGQVVGYSYANQNGTTIHAFLWTAATGMQDLGTLGGYNSVAEAINNAGQVVGCSDTSTGTTNHEHTFLWTQTDGMQDLGTLGLASCAAGLNDVGQIVGYSTISRDADSHAFLWTAATGMQDLGIPVSPITEGNSINDKGMVVGEYSDSAGYHAFLWTQDGGIQDLGNLGEPFAIAGSINASGVVVGFGASPTYPLAGFRWTASGGMQALPTPYPGYEFAAYTISPTGEIVGLGSNTIGLSRALVWFTPTDVHDMNSLTVNSPMILDVAYGVNSLGQIVGVGKLKSNSTEEHAFLANPNGK